MKKTLLVGILLALTAIVYAQQTQPGKVPVRTSDKSPAYKKTTVQVPVSNSGGSAQHTTAAVQSAPLRKADPASPGKMAPAAADTKSSPPKILPPSATPVKHL